MDHTHTSSSEVTANPTTNERDAAAPHCARCQDIGYYVLDVPPDHPGFGKLISCECRRDYLQASEHNRRLGESNLTAFADKTFATFDPDVLHKDDLAAYRTVRAYADRHPFEGWLVLYGSYGCGKTHLAAAAANQALERGYRVIFSVVPDLLDHLRRTFGPQSDSNYDQVFEDIREVPVLVLDDLGTENTTPWAREKLYQIINHRYNYRSPTIITTNQKLEAIDPRVFSRMSDLALHGGLIMMKSGDYRANEQRRKTAYHARKP